MVEVRKFMLKKGIVLIIISLFIGTSISPITTFNVMADDPPSSSYITDTFEDDIPGYIPLSNWYTFVINNGIAEISNNEFYSKSQSLSINSGSSFTFELKFCWRVEWIDCSVEYWLCNCVFDNSKTL